MTDVSTAPEGVRKLANNLMFAKSATDDGYFEVSTYAIRATILALLKANRERDESATTLVANLIEHDGGEGSKDYHAIQYYDARQAVLKFLNTSKAGDPSNDRQHE